MEKLQMVVLILKFLKIVGPHLLEAFERIKAAWGEFQEGNDADKAKAIAKDLVMVVDKLKPHVEDLPEVKELVHKASSLASGEPKEVA